MKTYYHTLPEKSLKLRATVNKIFRDTIACDFGEQKVKIFMAKFCNGDLVPTTRAYQDVKDVPYQEFEFLGMNRYYIGIAVVPRQP